MAKDEVTPTVTLIVLAHDEEDVIGARVENLLELDYPEDKLQVVVASDGSTDRTDEIVSSYEHGRVRLLPATARARLQALNRAVRETESEVLAFGDANATGLRMPCASSCALRPPRRRLRVRAGALRRAGRHQQGGCLLALRDAGSARAVALGWITGGNGAITWFRRSDYVDGCSATTSASRT